MANKERNKRSARKARSQERVERETAKQTVAPVEKAEEAKPSKIPFAKASEDKSSKAAAPAKVEKKAPEKPKHFAKLRNYFSSVRTEMRRVVWPSKQELRNYTVAVVAMLVVFGVAIWLIDTGVAALLGGFAGLRG